MSETDIILGHYWRNAATCNANTHLIPLDNDAFNRVIGELNAMDRFVGSAKTADGSTNAEYKSWKAHHLPILYFTRRDNRPSDNDNTICASGYAVIDIDNMKSEVNVIHPCVQFINHTHNGSHIFVFSKALLKARTPYEWQSEYNKIAVEIHQIIARKHKEVKFDGSLSRIDWGIYLWYGKWLVNNESSMEWMPEDVLVTQSDIGRIYENYKPARVRDILVNVNSKKESVRAESEDDGYKTSANYTERLLRTGIDETLLSFFNHNSLKKFVMAYHDDYEPIESAKPKHSEYKCYDGSVCEAAILNKSMPKVWRPYDTAHKIEKGNRRKELYKHVKKARLFLLQLDSDDNKTAERENYDVNRLFYDAVRYAYCSFEGGHKYSKDKIRRSVYSALVHRFDEFDKPSLDKRNTAMGRNAVDTETGEIVPMTTSMKRNLAPKVNKTERIKKLLKQWNPLLDTESNISELKDYGYEGVEKLTERTMVSYLKTAASNTEFTEMYPWLLSYKVESGRKPVRIRRREDGEVLEFKTAKECYEWLGISEKTFHTKFKKGRGEAAKLCELIG